MRPKSFAAFLLSMSVSATVAPAPPQEWVVPEEERAKENPIDASAEAIAEGEGHYKKQCLMCHGESLKGDGPAVAMFQAKPPDLSTKEARERLTDGEIFFKITEGRNPMPSMRTRLSEEERWKLIHFVRTLQAK